MSIGSVVFSSYVLRKRNEMPKIKGKKIYKPHGFYSIKNTVGKVLSLRHHVLPVPPGTRCPPLPPLFPDGGERRPRGTAGAPPRARRRPHLQSRVCPTRTLSFASNCFLFCVFFVCLFVLDIPRMEQKLKHPPPPPIVSYCSFSASRSAERWKTESWKSLCSQVHGSRGCWPRSAASATHKWCPWPPPSTPLPVPSPVSARCPRRPAASLPQQPVGKEMRPGPLPGGAAVSPEARDAL